MNTNGYKVIDFQGVDPTDADVKIDGIYNAINTADKPILITNIAVASGDTTKVIKPYFATPCVCVPISPTHDAYILPYMFAEGQVTYFIVMDDDTITTGE